MDTETTFGRREIVSFGPFSLVVSERMLTRDGVPLDLGGRALDVLIALISRPNKVVSKKELMADVWPGVIVSDGSLRFQITTLRQALDDGKDGARYISNVVGRGYCFVAEITRTGSPTPAEPPLSHSVGTSLPPQLANMVGRSDDLNSIVIHLAQSRIVSIVGPGGVGKTSVAVQVGHNLLKVFRDEVVFVDLSVLNDASMVPTAIASALRLSVRSVDPVPNLIAYLRDRRTLLVLDNCEHVIDAAAILAERISLAVPDVRILTTSREPLRAHGEHVHRLSPLASPPDDPDLTAEVVLSYPAARLFVDRAGASGATLDLSDADAPIVASICRRLDGLALAIELAARRVASYGLHQTAKLLYERLTLSWPGQRTARPRHQTMQAMLDWSYDLLQEQERVVLCRLPVFAGEFTLDAARHVAADDSLTQGQVVNAISSLAEKSLLSVHGVGMLTHYRLLESTREYALLKAGEDIGFAALRHAQYFRDWLEKLETEDGALSSSSGRSALVADLGNVLAALEWCFGPWGNKGLGVSLASAAVPAFLALSLLAECRRWSERALADFSDSTRDGRSEMRLQAALGLSQMFTRGNSEPSRLALEKSLTVADQLGDASCQVQLLGNLQIFHERMGDFITSLSYANRSAAVAAGIDDPVAVATANSLVGLCSHLLGDQRKARPLLEAAVAGMKTSRRVHTASFGFDHRNRASIALARTLWLLGFPNQAVQTANRTVDEARRLDQPVTLCIALIWAVSVYLWVGELDKAEQAIDRFISYAESHSLTPYLAVGRGVKGELAVKRGNPKTGVQAIEECLVELHDSHYELLTTAFHLTLAEGLTACGRIEHALELIDRTVAHAHASGDLYNLPEFLRIKARALLIGSDARSEEAVSCLMESLNLSRRQGARAWELRTSKDLARLWEGAGRITEARGILQDILGQFEEGFDTADLHEANELLRSLGEDAA